jgi:hypothetical protein
LQLLLGLIELLLGFVAGKILLGSGQDRQGADQAGKEQGGSKSVS